MMKRALLFGLVLSGIGAAAGAQFNSTPQALYFSAKELDGLQAGLAAAPDADGVTSSRFLNPESGTHDLRLFHRTVGGGAALHRDRTYIFFVKSGAASMQVGGELVNPVTNGADVDGTAIRGGQVLRVGPGDVITIPPNVPQVWIMEPGQFVAYSLLRVRQARDATP
jgi:mannose-6-phosphate isomerase-like protein (cupin superfamily)